MTELGDALGVLVTALGVRSGLWAALAGAGPLTAAEVSARVSVEPSLVREWLRAQAAGGYLTYTPETETFTLPDDVAAAIHFGPGGVRDALSKIEHLHPDLGRASAWRPADGHGLLLRAR